MYRLLQVAAFAHGISLAFTNHHFLVYHEFYAVFNMYAGKRWADNTLTLDQPFLL